MECNEEVLLFRNYGYGFACGQDDHDYSFTLEKEKYKPYNRQPLQRKWDRRAQKHCSTLVLSQYHTTLLTLPQN